MKIFVFLISISLSTQVSANPNAENCYQRYDRINKALGENMKKFVDWKTGTPASVYHQMKKESDDLFDEAKKFAECLKGAKCADDYWLLIESQQILEKLRPSLSAADYGKRLADLNVQANGLKLVCVFKNPPK